jgi:hypothetical protein
MNEPPAVGALMDLTGRVVVGGGRNGPRERSQDLPGVVLGSSPVEACRLLGVEPRDAVAFEDSRHGVQAAKSAGMTCVGIPERDGVDLTTDGADLVVGSLAELVDQAPTRVGSAGPGMIRSNC